MERFELPINSVIVGHFFDSRGVEYYLPLLNKAGITVLVVDLDQIEERLYPEWLTDRAKSVVFVVEQTLAFEAIDIIRRHTHVVGGG